MAKPYKIVLSKKTYGVALGYLKAFFSKPYASTHDWAVNPLLKSSFKQEDYYVIMARKAVVTGRMHESPIMIHIEYDLNHANVLYEGDIIYLFGGSKIITHKLNDTLAKTIGYADRPTISHIAYHIKISEDELQEIESRDKFDREFNERMIDDDDENDYDENDDQSYVY